MVETETPAKDHSQAVPRSLCTNVADVQLGLQVDPKQLKWGISQKLLHVGVICFPNWVALTDLRERGCAKVGGCRELKLLRGEGKVI
jgi:hypothetical protein